jgi:hypothetical protein
MRGASKIEMFKEIVGEDLAGEPHRFLEQKLVGLVRAGEPTSI